MIISQSTSTTRSLCTGTDTGLQRNNNRTFVTRSDCSRACRDQDLEKAARNNPSVSFKFFFERQRSALTYKLVNTWIMKCPYLLLLTGDGTLLVPSTFSS